MSEGKQFIPLKFPLGTYRAIDHRVATEQSSFFAMGVIQRHILKIWAAR
jgi:hypothetical protein